MRYSLIAAPAVLAASVSAGEYTAYYTTEIVSTLTTYCSSATSLSINGKIHTVTEATTLTISECPCTLTHPVVATTSSTPVAPKVTPVLSSFPLVTANSSSSPAVILSTAPSAIVSTIPTAPGIPLSSVVSVAPYPVSNSTLVSVGTASAGTIPVPAPSAPSAPLASASVTSPTVQTPFKGLASRTTSSSVSLVALIGLAAYLL